MRNSRIEVQPIAGACGAELHGVDLAAAVDDDNTIAGIRQALLDHCVIFFRDQTLEPPQHKALARKFGDIFIHPNYNGVAPHPETKRKLLFVNASYTIGFEDMTEAESKPLLDYLLEHGHRPEFTCRFRWQPGSVAFWDNRCVKHIAVHDAGPYRRLMRRVQICGDRPY